MIAYRRLGEAMAEHYGEKFGPRAARDSIWALRKDNLVLQLQAIELDCTREDLEAIVTRAIKGRPPAAKLKQRLNRALSGYASHDGLDEFVEELVVFEFEGKMQ
jgi:hypothetical protein